MLIILKKILTKFKAECLYKWRSDAIYQKIFHENQNVKDALKTINEVVALDKILKCIDKDLHTKNKTIHGKFFYEFIPVVLLAQKVKAESITLIQDESLQYDAELKFDKAIVQKVECVTAMDHKHDRIRIEHLKLYGHAPGLHDVISAGNKRNRKIEEAPFGKTFSSKELEEKTHDRLIPEIREQFTKKLSKQTNGVYQDTALLIIIDDYLFPDKEKLKEWLEEIIREISNTPNDFSEIYLIGIENFFFQIK